MLAVSRHKDDWEEKLKKKMPELLSKIYCSPHFVDYLCTEKVIQDIMARDLKVNQNAPLSPCLTLSLVPKPLKASTKHWVPPVGMKPRSLRDRSLIMGRKRASKWGNHFLHPL